ncbi:MAG TPA: hypothetical protein HPP83_11015, partial [Candidatus Hydrogenedentes bacterium]|nr:hypothetical protein [Candidatus Hydrogenedentota bacterium]
MKRPRAQVVFALGFFALAAQTLLFRDFLAAFEGNELGVGSFFSSWLLWVAAGAVAGRLSRVTRRFEVLTLLYLPAFVLQHYAILYVRILAGVKSYELFPLGTMIASSFVANAPVSFLTGFLFTLGCRWWAGDTESERGVRETLPVARVYILEALGACAGGVAVTLLLAQGTPPETIATLAALVLASAVAAARVSSPARLAATAVLVAALASGATRSWAALNNRAEWTRLLPSDEYRGSFSTAQGKYLYGYEGEEFAVMAWGGVCETPFIRIHAAEVIAANLCQRPNARNVLVVGPGSLPICLGLLE